MNQLKIMFRSFPVSWYVFHNYFAKTQITPKPFTDGLTTDFSPYFKKIKFYALN